MSRTVVVTGGRGHSGRWIVDHLASEGWSVVCLDRSHPGYDADLRERIDARAVDLTDRGQTFEAIAEIDPDAVVHWAALPTPERDPGGVVFETNTMATYNVLVAAGQNDARVVWASSESAYGFPFAEETPMPDTLPITEEHPMRPEDPYGLSKVAGEEVAEMVVRRYGIPVISSRLSWIQYPGQYQCTDNTDVSAGVGNFWSYVDVRDVATYVAAALETSFDSHEAFHVAAEENYFGESTADLFEEQFGEVPTPCHLEGEQSALSTAKAQTLLEWEPAHTYREAADEDVEPPELTA